MGTLRIDVVGAGVLGLWQALTLARAGHAVRLLEATAIPFSSAQSRFAGAMLAPWCEAEAAEAVVLDAGIDGLAMWRATYPGLVEAGTLVVAAARDGSEIRRFARMTSKYETIGAERIAELEPDLAGRFSSGLFFPAEAHMATPDALSWLLDAARAAGADVRFDTSFDWAASTADHVVDCRGLGARKSLAGLRGVRGERLLVRARDARLTRPVRLLHPRHPLYVVPWRDGLHMIGATVIESEDDSAMTVRSALELLGLAYALSPAFGEAEIVELGAGVRPAYPDNVPRALVRGRHILVNGAFRHGFLLAPVLAHAVAAHISGNSDPGPLLLVDRQAE